MLRWTPPEGRNRAIRSTARTRGTIARHAHHLMGQLTHHLNRAGAGAGRDRGSISIWIATGGLVMIVLAGMTVDLGGQVYAQEHARDIARQAARAGGQQLQAAPAIRGEAAVVDPTAAIRAASTYLAASDVSGSATVTGGHTVVVNTTAVYPTKFLSIIGINRLTVTGHAEATITRAVAGVPR